jgi:hypothetical protein
MSYSVRETTSIDFDVAIESDINSWNEYLMELVSEPMLQDIGWEVIGLNDDGDIVLEVTGYVEDEGEEETIDEAAASHYNES